VSLAVAVSACEEGVQPVLQTDRPFTIYGYFNPLADTQSVRLFTIDGVLEHTAPEPIDVVFDSRDVESGETVSWQDSLVQFSSGMWGHVFWSDFRPAHLRTYSVAARAPDGRVTSAQATVPPLATPEVGETDIFDFTLPIPILWRDAPNLIDIVATYRTSAGTEVVRYGVEQNATAAGSVVTLQFRRDTRGILFDAIRSGIDEVTLDTVEVRVVVTNAEWTPPGGVFDPDVLVEPGTFSNVENGFGFIGAGYPMTMGFKPDDDLLRVSGFHVE
jgi:hypothetical protein